MIKIQTLLVSVASILTVNLASVSSVYAQNNSPNYLKKMAREAANRYRVEEKLIFAIIQQESGWQTSVVSSAGAIGIMQIMPKTGKGFCGLTKKQLYNPYQNLDCGVRYFSRQLKDFGGNVKLALCAYNAGPGNANKGLKRCNRIKETRRYIRKVIAIWGNGKINPIPYFPDSAKRIADSWYKGGRPPVWWRLVCEAIDFVYDRKMEQIDPTAVGKSATTQRQLNVWKKVLRATANDIHNDNSRLSRTKIKRNILAACPKESREVRQTRKGKTSRVVVSAKSAKTIADNWFINGNYTYSQWWKLVCQAIDVVYDKEIGTIGQPAIAPYQRRLWDKILNTTVNDIHIDELRLKGSDGWSKTRITNKIIQGCPKGRS